MPIPSFIDLTANDVWTEAAISERLHATIRGTFSENAELALSRAIQTQALGIRTLTPAELALVAQFKALTDDVAVLGTQVRADAALLNQVLTYESRKAEWAMVVDETRGVAPTVLTGAALTLFNQRAAAVRALQIVARQTTQTTQS